jgi:hypothetical protein
MTAAQSVPLGTAPPQFDALAADDSVVTLTVGGNDIGFNSILKTCGPVWRPVQAALHLGRH